IWVVDIQAGEGVAEDQLRHELQEMGVQVWSSSKNMDLQQLRYDLLNRIPGLSWVAVNRQGGRICVMALGRETRENEYRFRASHLYAARDGVITRSEILEGMALCKVGESVKQGQLLVSGLEDYGLYMKAVDAKGEIYGQTWYSGTLVTPQECYKKRYTGRSWTDQSILFGRKRINLSGSSSILGVLCDKMIDTKQLSLPGFRFPLMLQRITYREYILEPASLSSVDAKELLAQRWSRSLMSAMVAGTVEHTDSVCFENGGLYIMQSESICNELLSRTMPLEPPYEGEMPEWNASLMQKE
ncbi:MAG: sporulation protein YqfD, partial [Oscillospiraceae bacterium]|nr:sporulation protein YqfD [Oscillospiraceae bacterium]